MGTVVVTGTSTGLGFATAVSIARAGHDVYATMRDLGKAGDIRSIAEQEKIPIQVLQLDVDDDDSVENAIKQVLQEKGKLDVLVNNAGIGTMGSVEELPLSEFRQCMETNFFGPIRCIKAVVPSMREARSGLIVNVSSVAGKICVTPQAPYSASKFALEAMSEALAGELKPFNVRVVLVEPGIIQTPIFDKMKEATEESIYPSERRINALFAAALENPVSSFVVGDAIRDIAASDSWQLRYPVGPDAEGFLEWRASLSDEEWVDFGAQTDGEWVAYVKDTFELDVTPHF
jgi:NAD(P)-dependent dehydrogenase (short-subunit alcohol dehydrogenase family)